MLNHKPGPVENHYCFVFFYSVRDIWYNHTEYCPPFIQLVLNSACWVFPWRIPQQHGPELVLDQCYVSLYRIRYVPGTAQIGRKKKNLHAETGSKVVLFLQRENLNDGRVKWQKIGLHFLCFSVTSCSLLPHWLYLKVLVCEDQSSWLPDLSLNFYDSFVIDLNEAHILYQN